MPQGMPGHLHDLERMIKHVNNVGIAQCLIAHRDFFRGGAIDARCCFSLKCRGAAHMVEMMVSDENVGEPPVRVCRQPRLHGCGITRLDYSAFFTGRVTQQPDIVVIEGGQSIDLEHGELSWSVRASWDARVCRSSAIRSLRLAAKRRAWGIHLLNLAGDGYDRTTLCTSRPSVAGIDWRGACMVRRAFGAADAGCRAPFDRGRAVTLFWWLPGAIRSGPGPHQSPSNTAQHQPWRAFAGCGSGLRRRGLAVGRARRRSGGLA